jgi:nicotinate-nucleotide adenylyltransferase
VCRSGEQALNAAIFGGTFDPVHCGHLAVAREAMRAGGLARVLFVPAYRPPHKHAKAHAPYEDRYNMVVLACRHDPAFEPSRLEEGTGNSYSIDTIAKVRAGLNAGDKLYFIIGADAFAEIQTWHRWAEVVTAVEFIVVSRPGFVFKSPAGARVHYLDTLALPVSSTEIRRKLAAGIDPVEVPPDVLHYIREHGLYGPAVCNTGRG